MEEITVIENCELVVSHNLPEKSLSLTFFDSMYFHFPPMRSVISFTCQQADLTIVPNLKKSLCDALRYYYPLAGNLLLNPSASSELEIQCTQRDFVSFTVAECSSDFDYFVGNHPRSVKRLLSLIPRLPTPIKKSENILAPLFALQVTIFPNKGICIGFTWHHVVGDASTIVGFTKAWASVYKHGSDSELLSSGTLPSYNRSLVPDLQGLSNTFKIQQESTMGIIDLESPQVDFSETPDDLVRSSFVLSRSNIQNLKSILLAKHPTLGHVSSFVVTTGYFWSCLAKLRANFCEEISEDQTVDFLCGVECRERLDPPLPTAYFGNCAGLCFARIKHIDLLGEEGFINGAKTIREAIHKFLHTEGGLLKGAENWMLDVFEVDFERLLSVAGSPKFSRYDVDFGWGKPEKVDLRLTPDALSIDPSPYSEGGLEIGLCLTEHKMDAFKVIFADNLKSLN